MQPELERSAAAMIAGAQKAIAEAVAPLLRRIETLEARPAPERGEKGDPGQVGEPGRDGVGLADALIDRDGVLVLTLHSGEHRRLGVVVGKDGADGLPGEKGDKGDPGERGEPGEKGDLGEPGAPGLPGLNGKHGDPGAAGRDGKDGFSLEDFDIEAGEDGRTVTMRFQQGDVRHCYELVFPVIIDRGIFKADREQAYRPGDGVTWGGSYWIAQSETKAKPDGPDSGWRLAVKRGRDGKDGRAAT